MADGGRRGQADGEAGQLHSSGGGEAFRREVGSLVGPEPWKRRCEQCRGSGDPSFDVHFLLQPLVAW